MELFGTYHRSISPDLQPLYLFCSFACFVFILAWSHEVGVNSRGQKLEVPRQCSPLNMVHERKATSHSSSNFWARVVPRESWRAQLSHSSGACSGPRGLWEVPLTQWPVYGCSPSSQGELVKRDSISYPCKLWTQTKYILNSCQQKCSPVKPRLMAMKGFGMLSFIKQRVLH